VKILGCSAVREGGKGALQSKASSDALLAGMRLGMCLGRLPVRAQCTCTHTHDTRMDTHTHTCTCTRTILPAMPAGTHLLNGLYTSEQDLVATLPLVHFTIFV
jgi:hypothetical protein